MVFDLLRLVVTAVDRGVEGRARRALALLLGEAKDVLELWELAVRELTIA